MRSFDFGQCVSPRLEHRFFRCADWCLKKAAKKASKGKKKSAGKKKGRKSMKKKK